jgi:hypothetical protein
MEGWHVAIIIGAVQFAASFGGVLTAVKYLGQNITHAQKTADQAHDRISSHLVAHAEGKLS